MDDLEVERRPAESEHSWTWIVKKCSSHLNSPVGTKIESPYFTIGNYSLRFLWYPGGFDASTQEYVGVQLKNQRFFNVTIKFSIHLGYDTIKMFKMTKCNKNLDPITGSNPSFGDFRLVKREILLDQVLQLSNDELMIKCVIHGLDIPESHSRFQLLDNYEKFVDNEKLSDVKIVVGKKLGKKIIHAHKLVLANGSDVFAAMFEHDMTENEEGIVNIDDIDYDVMLEIVRYLYTGKIERIFHKTKELVVAADKYGLMDLKTLCGKYLCMDLSPSNIFEYIKFADRFNIIDLKNSSESYFIFHGKEIVKLPDFDEQLATINGELTAKLVKKLVERLN
ncbi:hypothetical protein QAD02_001125 [Eretmocerus hayati]|uniref:Uncharacterized protein n=1 Tax=Eretmocerus hayati TaxID=131215 RepID=A0ACC2NGV3_9HYME|nr:hypothetical protein QAD02_001125 [Eretmocerus hayati]